MEYKFMFHIKVGWHKGNVFLSYCKLFVEIYGSVFKKSLGKNLNLVRAPHDTSSRRAWKAVTPVISTIIFFWKLLL